LYFLLETIKLKIWHCRNKVVNIVIEGIIVDIRIC